jgi:hypothetical protein
MKPCQLCGKPGVGLTIDERIAELERDNARLRVAAGALERYLESAGMVERSSLLHRNLRAALDEGSKS